MRKVALGSTFYAAIGSRAFATGIPAALAGTPDVSCIELDGTNAVIDTGATIAAHGSLTAVNILTVIATSANGYEYGKVYGVVVDTGTVGGVSAVGEVIYEFQIMTAAEEAAQNLITAIYPTDGVIITTAGNTTSAINCTEVIDSTATADHMNGEILAIQWVGGTYDGLVLFARVTNYVVTNQLATVELINGGMLPEAVAAGDKVWRFNQYTADAWRWRNVALVAPTVTGVPAVDTQYINAAEITGDGAATPFDVA